MKRRDALKNGLGVAAALSLAGTGRTSSLPGARLPGGPPGKFKLNYAPSFGQFKAHAGDDLDAQIQFCADEGFTAMFDNGLMDRPAADRDKIASGLAKRGMALGPFVLYADFSKESFVLRNDEIKALLAGLMKKGFETMKYTGCQQALVVPGRYNQNLFWDYQTANVIDNLRDCAESAAQAGLVLVLEPLNRRDHPGLFLTGMPQAYAICRAVNSPSVKILDDMYHQQITEGNLIPHLDACWDEIAAFHIGDNPGRKEPTTGEINYRNVFKRIYDKGFKGVLGMEHGSKLKGKEGERAVIEAYRACDNF
jgi:sugar phosphate isomerase/epimerase